MARLTGANIEQFRNEGSGDGTKINYFNSLKDDKDTGKIRLLYEGAEDIEGFVVHRVQVGDYELPVNCLFDSDGTVSDCPFCKAGLKRQARVYIPVFDETDGAIKFWDRPNSFYSQLSSLCGRFPHIVSQVFDVERHGAKGKKSDYSFYPVGQPDGTTVDDILADCGFDELPSALGTKIMDKSAEDMEYYLKHEKFPDEDRENVIRRGEDTSARRESTRETARSERATTRRGRGDRF